jgi:DNA-binding transcriptional regulator GbsR (MarR family)
MNNMKSKDQTRNLRKLSLSIGLFIRYWGFRRIHGAIWTQLYLSKIPMSCTDLTAKLGLSKALISPALDELCKYKLIQVGPAPNDKTKVYVAAENVNEVIQHVLRNREAKMMKQITDDFSALNSSKLNLNEIDEKKIESLGAMIFSANMMLEILIAQKDIMKVPLEIT